MNIWTTTSHFSFITYLGVTNIRTTGVLHTQMHYYWGQLATKKEQGQFE